jgi:anti-sigma B factor antagonist
VNLEKRLRVESRVESDRVVLELHGELDLVGAPLLARELERAERDERRILVLDLEDLEFIDSAGLRVILAAHERLRLRGGDLALTPGPAQVQRLLTIAGVSEHLLTIASSDAMPTPEPGGREAS